MMFESSILVWMTASCLFNFNYKLHFIFLVCDAIITFHFSIFCYLTFLWPWALLFLLLCNICFGNTIGSAVCRNVKSYYSLQECAVLLEIQGSVSVCAQLSGEDAHVHAALWVWLVLLYLLSWPLDSLSGSLHHCCVDLAVLFVQPFS